MEFATARPTQPETYTETCGSLGSHNKMFPRDRMMTEGPEEVLALHLGSASHHASSDCCGTPDGRR
jgi:hypothetical protein